MVDPIAVDRYFAHYHLLSTMDMPREFKVVHYEMALSPYPELE